MLGKKGNHQTGYIYAPFITEGTFSPRMSIRSRYSTAVIDTNLFKTIKIKTKDKNDRDYEDTNFEQWEEE